MPLTKNDVRFGRAFAHRFADPVTGTTGTFFYNTSLTFSRSESEPFGQSVAGSDPYLPDPDPPLDNPPPLNDAGEPEWQCLAPRELWGGFSGLPFHCQKALLQDFNYGLDEIYGFTNPHNPSSPSKVTTIIGLDSPIESPVIPGTDADGSGHSLALAAMLNPTSKKDDKKPKPVPESNLPKDPDVDLEKLSVTVRGGTSMVDEVNAHFDASKDLPIYGFPFVMPREAMPLVTGAVSSFLDKNPNCEAFVNNLLQQLEKDSKRRLELI